MAATFTSSGERKKRPHKYLCGTPQSSCTGGQGTTSHGLKNSKVHSTPQEAFRCQARYLISEGYKQVGPREFCKGDGPIRVLTKKSKFGHHCRGGKSNRQMPSTRATGGAIISM